MSSSEDESSSSSSDEGMKAKKGSKGKSSTPTKKIEVKTVTPKKSSKKKKQSPPPSPPEEPEPGSSKSTTLQNKKEPSGKKKGRPLKPPPDFDELAEGDKVPGLSIVFAMSKDDLEKFLQRVDKQCPIDDNKVVKTREALINWEEVSFSCYGPEQCKLAWTYLRNYARKFRIMHEVVEEVKYHFKSDFNRFTRKIIESAPDFPKQPYATGGFQFYCKELWDKYKYEREKLNMKVENFLHFQTKVYQDWGNLPEDVKEEYNNKAKLLQADFKQRVKEYYAKYPTLAIRPEKFNQYGKPETKSIGAPLKKRILKISEELYADAPKFPLTPLQLFMNAKLNRLDPPPTPDEIPPLKAHYMKRWKKLSNGKRLKWIESCIRKSEEYMVEIQDYKKKHPLFVLPKELQISKLITKDEFFIWAEAHGQPPKPKVNSFDLFYDEYRTKESGNDKTESELYNSAQQAWEKLDWYSKEMYKINQKTQQVNFQKEFEDYYKNIPHLLRPLAVDTLPKKYKKAFLEEVGKEPLVLDDEETELVDETSKKQKRAGADDASQPAKKKKKSQCDADEPEGGLESQEGTADDEGEEDGSPKKKKKKKKKSKDQEEVETRQDIPLYANELSEEHLKLLEEHRKTKAKEDARENSPKKKPYRSFVKSDETNLSSFAPGKPINQRELNEAIRGFFDGRQLWRRFSVYYFYAKYVAKEPSWVKLFNKIGVVATAARIIETFNRLSKHQQKIFLDKAYDFHCNQRLYRSRRDVNDFDMWSPKMYGHFPGEPKAPPSNARLLYEKDTREMQKADPDYEIVHWTKLDEKTQRLYIKKLYWLTREYILEYEEFVKNMTPNDMMEYFIIKCRDWDLHPNPTSDFVKAAVKTVAKSRLPSSTYCMDMSDDDQDIEPTLYETTGDVRNAFRSFRFKNNPFSATHARGQYSNLVKKLCKNKKRKKTKNKNTSAQNFCRQYRWKDPDPDLPSSSSDEEDFAEDQHYRNQKQFQKEVRDRQRYYYPLDDLYEDSIMNRVNKSCAPGTNDPWWLSFESERESNLSRMGKSWLKFRKALLKSGKNPPSAPQSENKLGLNKTTQEVEEKVRQVAVKTSKLKLKKKRLKGIADKSSWRKPTVSTMTNPFLQSKEEPVMHPRFALVPCPPSPIDNDVEDKQTQRSGEDCINVSSSHSSDTVPEHEGKAEDAGFTEEDIDKEIEEYRKLFPAEGNGDDDIDPSLVFVDEFTEEDLMNIDA